MITKSELLEFKIKEKQERSELLKLNHEWGNWDNWRTFTSLDIEINSLKMELLSIENEQLKESYESYKDYLNE